MSPEIETPTGQAAAPSVAWWGPYELVDGDAARWEIGPFRLRGHRRAPEWCLVFARGDERDTGEVRVEHPWISNVNEKEGDVLRVMSGDESGLLRLRPAPADRPVVARPEKAIMMLPKAKIRLYVSMVVWVQVELGGSAHLALDVPAWRLSDTWFGSSTGSGELCYAVRTKARLNVENLPLVGHRAILQVTLENRSQHSFSLERINLPAPNLALYADSRGYLWTDAVRVRLGGHDQLAEIDLGEGPPELAEGARRVAEPRVPIPRNILQRALGAFFQ